MAGHKRLAWCRLVGIPGVLDGTASSEESGAASSSTRSGDALPRAYLYLQCWDMSGSSNSLTNASHTQAADGTSDGAMHVKAEQQRVPSQPSVGSHEDAALLARYALTVHLLLTNNPAVWRCEIASLETLRPSYMSDRATFLRVFESTLRDAHAATFHGDLERVQPANGPQQQAAFHIFPAQLRPETTIARVDVRLQSRGGNASVAICAFHCSNVSATAPASSAAGDAPSSNGTPSSAAAVSSVLAAIAGDMQVLAGLQASSDAAHTAAAALEARMIDMGQKHLQDEEAILDGFVCILNQKKLRIQQLCGEVNALQCQLAELRRAFGSGHASSGDDDDGLGNAVATSSDVCIVAPPPQDGPIETTAGGRKRSRGRDDGDERSGDLGIGSRRQSPADGTLSAATSLDNLLQL